MTYRIFKFLKEYSFEPIIVDRLIISTFVKLNRLQIINNEFLKTYLIQEENTDEVSALEKFTEIILKEKKSLEIEDLIQLFEFVVSPAEKEVNGAVYTPDYIRSYILEKITSDITDANLTQTKFADIACGCGGFFYTLALIMKKRLNISFLNIYENNIFGIDIQSYSINRTKLLLCLLAIINGEDIVEFRFNLHVGNSLEFDWSQVEAVNLNRGFDVIIGNPPYVSSSKIDDESKALLSRWSVTKTGKPDLYIPFFQIGIENLRPGGILGYITVNNFYRSLNGRGFRDYLSSKGYPILIIDFGSEQIFRRRSTYTCICFIENSANGGIKYIKSSSKDIRSITDQDFIILRYGNLSNKNGWILQNNKISKNINKIESTGKPLGKCFEIRNGFATLKNDIFVFNSLNEDNDRYYFEKEGKGYWIEKDICRNAIKPNTLKTEGEISQKKEKLIFPYNSTKNQIGAEKTVQLMNERQLISDYPLAHKYLSDYKHVLSERDKGNREYSAWFAFGRSQALNIHGYKLLFPYISDTPYFVLSFEKDLLFYNGYALISGNKQELLIAQKVLSSKLFWYYIKYTSKPYGSNYFALAKNYVKNFGLFNFNENQKNFLLSTNDKKKIDDFLVNLYNIEL
jgi:methylase of polypeptide subunit release factors